MYGETQHPTIDKLVNLRTKYQEYGYSPAEVSMNPDTYHDLTSELVHLKYPAANPNKDRIDHRIMGMQILIDDSLPADELIIGD